jgi:hypothetical protein
MNRPLKVQNAVSVETYIVQLLEKVSGNARKAVRAEKQFTDYDTAIKWGESQCKQKQASNPNAQWDWSIRVKGASYERKGD